MGKTIRFFLALFCGLIALEIQVLKAQEPISEDELRRGFQMKISKEELWLKRGMTEYLEIEALPVGPHAVQSGFVVKTNGDLTGIKPELQSVPGNSSKIILGFNPLSSAKQGFRTLKVGLGNKGQFEWKTLRLNLVDEN